MPRAASRQYPRPLGPLTFGPIVGVTDSEQPSAARKGRARKLSNVYVPGGAPGLPAVGFPGFAVMGAQLGSGGARTAQFLGQLRKRSGTTHTIAIIGGKFYTLNWSTRVWTEVLTGANLAGAAITLSSSARVFGVEFQDQIVLSDGINTPWMWDGTAGAGLTKLTNAPIFYGAPWVYYAKLMGIKATERDTFVWSEEGDATTGYEAGGFNNAWSPLGATAFYAGAADNNGIYLFEERRTIRIEGAVDTAFQTSGTRSSVSETIGSKSPAVVTDGGVVFVDADARPHVIRDGVVSPLWPDCAVTVAATPKGALPAVQILELGPALGDMVLVGLPNANESSPSRFLAFRLSGGETNFIGLRTGFPAQASAIVVSNAGDPTWLHAGESDGYVYEHGGPTGTYWDDALVAGTVPIDHETVMPALAADLRGDKLFDRFDAVLAGPTAATIAINYTTPRGRSSDQSVTVTASGDLWDAENWDAMQWASAAVEQRIAVGLDAFGRWIAPEVRHSALGEQFALSAIAVEAYDIGTDPGIP